MPIFSCTYFVGSIQKQSMNTSTYGTSTNCTNKQQLPVYNKQQYLIENARVILESYLTHVL
jgi:hypothetical protein